MICNFSSRVRRGGGARQFFLPEPTLRALGGSSVTSTCSLVIAGRCPAPRWGSAPDPAEAKPQATICISGAPEPMISIFWLANHDDF